MAATAMLANVVCVLSILAVGAAPCSHSGFSPLGIDMLPSRLSGRRSLRTEVRKDASDEHIGRMVHEADSLTGICPSGSMEKTGRWVDNGYWFIDGPFAAQRRFLGYSLVSGCSDCDQRFLLSLQELRAVHTSTFQLEVLWHPGK